MSPTRGMISKGHRIPYGAMSGLPASARVRISEILAGKSIMLGPKPNRSRRPPRPGAPSWLTARRHEDESQTDPLQILLQAEERERVRAALATLDHRSRDAIRLLRGSPAKVGHMTLADVGAMHGCTRERIRQVLVESLQEMGNYLTEGEE